MTFLVGGISSAGRAFPDVQGHAFRVTRSAGAYLWHDRGQRYLDTAMGFGATLLGHAPPPVLEAVAQAQAEGPMPSFAHALEEAAAAALAARCGDLSQVIFLNTGSEAVHLACRTARIATGRGRIVKFAAAYDGWYDPVAFGNAQSPAARMTGARPERDGMLLLRYNDFADVERLFAEYDDIAAILMEPVLANAGCLEPAPGYLQYVTDRAHRNGALVILDEVLMGFRLHAGLTGHYLGVDADLTAVSGGQWLAAAATLGDIARLGASAGKVFLLENLNTAVDHPGVPFARAEDTLALIEAVASPYLRLNLDLYHAQIGEGNLIELVRRAGPAIGEIQVADVPGRCEPGTGEIHYLAIARALAKLGYRGVVGLEGWASEGDTERALERFRTAFTV
ncbi:aminotransferase class III-fold pyridoxal phosphate-dependent enzyme [Pseudomonas psychrotolerans]|uniref:aminotransferase class III-fold pyridoxal phosphate-dependent enzyme n=1 Tax=Pseudomonas oryzihabitans TaxID=47885 RepID=UPI0015E3A55B|nr:aminotransferase class III-fold pyridoxal phosphate-dependent enzyme [Pseudomonas psychrotolerans]MBA1183408.1 aminotransferase class III-fold pyridoxal phosphate-dependent enzyme [Pseudomonas psychrotolerans]